MYIKKIEKVTLKACYIFLVIMLITIFFRKYHDVLLYRDRALRGEARGCRARRALHGAAPQRDQGEERGPQEEGARAGAEAPARGGRDEGGYRGGRGPAVPPEGGGGVRAGDEEEHLEAGVPQGGGQVHGGQDQDADVHPRGQHHEGQVHLRPRHGLLLGRPGVRRCRRRRCRRRRSHHLAQGGGGWTPPDRAAAGQPGQARHLQPQCAGEYYAQQVQVHRARELLLRGLLRELR